MAPRTHMVSFAYEMLGAWLHHAPRSPSSPLLCSAMLSNTAFPLKLRMHFPQVQSRLSLSEAIAAHVANSELQKLAAHHGPGVQRCCAQCQRLHALAKCQPPCTRAGLPSLILGGLGQTLRLKLFPHWHAFPTATWTGHVAHWCSGCHAGAATPTSAPRSYNTSGKRAPCPHID